MPAFLILLFYTISNKLLPTQRELKGLEARHRLKRIVILLSKSITQHISLLNSPFGSLSAIR